MGDDYEILDPTKAEPNANVEPAPETPIQSSIEKTVVGVGPAIGGSKRKNGKANQTGKAILGKKDVEIKVEKTKLTKKDEEKAVQQRRSDKELVDEGEKQENGNDKFIYILEYESSESSVRRAFLITTALGFTLCLLYGALGIILLGYNKQLDFKFG